ncbi:cytochrome d ubiquinol oxidase subunit II [Castellaniella hirudinis]|uniref:cytochrome d ubiquinol oxidase subunit II n=1 Tax=Castellaniella hirudinis TaxID=1144617 RepID=UPI0039C08E4A
MESLIPFDFSTLRVIWWVLLGLLLTGFAIMDGFDLGIAAALPLVARTDTERRIVLNVVGPVWEGNQVWLILSGGAVFAAWPLLYAMSFSGFYLAMLLLLLTLILRPLCFQYRSKMAGARWRGTWDALLCAGGVVAALVFGVAVGNVILGVPFDYEAATLRPYYQGSLMGLFTPFPLLCGVLALCMMLKHGAILLAWKTEGAIAARARALARLGGLLTALLFALAGAWVAWGLQGYAIVGFIDYDAIATPLGKAVQVAPGAWMHNYGHWPLMWLAPAAGVLGAVLATVLVGRPNKAWAFLASAASLAGILWTFGLSLFPFLLPSSLNPNVSLTVWDASSSPLSLWIMLLATAFFLPIIIAYTAWVYRIMRGKVTEKNLEGHAY